MRRTETVILANMCMICDGSRVVVENRADANWPGFAFPGGHVEKGESFTDAVIREVFEETGLKISSPILCGIKDWVNDDGSRYIVLLYKTNKFEGTLTSSDEGEVSWAELSELDKMSLASGMDKMLKVFLNDEISELFFYKENDEWIEFFK